MRHFKWLRDWTGLCFRPGRRVTGDVLQFRKLLKVQVIGTQTKMHLYRTRNCSETVPRFQASKKMVTKCMAFITPHKEVAQAENRNSLQSAYIILCPLELPYMTE